MGEPPAIRPSPGREAAHRPLHLALPLGTALAVARSRSTPFGGRRGQYSAPATDATNATNEPANRDNRNRTYESLDITSPDEIKPFAGQRANGRCQITIQISDPEDDDDFGKIMLVKYSGGWETLRPQDSDPYRVIIEAYPQIQEMDLNPVIAYEDKITIVDARIILKPFKEP